MSLAWVIWRASTTETIRSPGRRRYSVEHTMPEPTGHSRGSGRTPPSSAPAQEIGNSESGAGTRAEFSSLSPLEIARYMRDVQGQRPVPTCDPQHLYVSASHRDGYIDRQGRKRPGCKSPGKAPLVPQWQLFSSRVPTDEELVRMFATHKGNIGNVVLNGRIILDVDVRSGGLATLKLLQDVYEPLPETPTQRTGGGGYHYHFLWPDGVALPSAGGSLAALEYPGVEWKGPTQQVIVAPSTYPGTGAAYEWVEGAALEDVAVAPIPAWLLTLILQVNQPSRPRKATELNPAQAGSQQTSEARPKLKMPEIVEAFSQMYPEGGRRAGTGVPRLVGIIKGHGVEEDEAVRWFLWWQQTHLLPPLSDATMEDLVRDQYRRYPLNREGKQQKGRTTGTLSNGADGMGCSARDTAIGGQGAAAAYTGGSSEGRYGSRQDRRTHKGKAHGHQFLAKLFSAVAGPAALSPDGSPITQDEASDLTSRAIAEMRNDALFSQRRQAQNRHLDSTQSSEMQMPILLADRRFILSKDELYDNLVYAEGPDAKILERLEHCLWDGAMMCWEHGDQFGTKCMCRLFVHYDCIHQSTLKVRQLNLPDIPRDKGCYISLRLQWTTPVYTDTAPETGHQTTSVFVGMEREDFQKQIRRLGQRKREKVGGTILAHSVGFLLARPDTIVEGRVLFRLDGTDRTYFDAAIALLCERLGARVTGERVYQEGESVVVQLMEDSMSSFLGMEDKTDTHLFAAFYWELKGKTLFQGLGELYQMLRAIKKEEPALCPVCQRVLRLRPIPPEETLRKRAEGRDSASPAPAPPSPPPKQARLVV